MIFSASLSSWLWSWRRRAPLIWQVQNICSTDYYWPLFRCKAIKVHRLLQISIFRVHPCGLLNTLQANFIRTSQEEFYSYVSMYIIFWKFASTYTCQFRWWKKYTQEFCFSLTTSEFPQIFHFLLNVGL